MSESPRNPAPLIGVTPDIDARASKEGENHAEPSVFLPPRYLRAVLEVGGIPVILPVIASKASLRRILTRVDGLLVTGGNFDIHPRWYGETPIAELGNIKNERTDFELELVAIALKQDVPVLGVCGGAQAINVALGGSLYQDIAAQLPWALEHERGAVKEHGGHRVHIHEGTRLAKIVKQDFLEVNTTHHQAVKRLGKGLVANATADDGLIEGIESADHSFVLGVQWHPEVLAPKNAVQRDIFASFISTARRPRPRR